MRNGKLLILILAALCGACSDAAPEASPVDEQEVAESADVPQQPTPAEVVSDDLGGLHLATFEGSREALFAALDEQQLRMIARHPQEWELVQTVFGNAQEKRSPQRDRHEHESALVAIPPNRLALMLRAISQEERCSTAFRWAVVVYTYIHGSPGVRTVDATERDQYLSVIAGMLMYGTDFHDEAARVALWVRSSFSRHQALSAWQYILSRGELIADTNMIERVQFYHDILAGTIELERLRHHFSCRLSLWQIERDANGIQIPAGTGHDFHSDAFYILRCGQAWQLQVLDNILASYTNRWDGKDDLQLYLRPAGLVGYTLFANGHRETLVAYARIMVDEHAFGHDFQLPDRVRDYIAHPNFPSSAVDMADAAHGADSDVTYQGRAYARAVARFLISDEFANTVWHPGLRLWVTL